MKKAISLAALLLYFFTAAPALAREWYVSPTGRSSNSGSQSSPWDLQTALNHPSAVRAGDTIYLLDGTYGSGGDKIYNSNLRGTSSAPIILRGYPGARATVNGAIWNTTNSQYVWYWGFEIMNTMTGRRVCSSDRPTGLKLIGGHNKVINMIINNTGHPGVAFYRDTGVDNDEVYGTIIWSSGVFDVCRTDSPRRGSAIYAQHKDGTAKIHDVISFRNFSTGMKAYTEKDYANGFDFEGNINFANGDLNLFASGRDNPIQYIRLANNYFWRETSDSVQRNVQFGYEMVSHKTLIFQNNYLVAGNHAGTGGLYVSRFSDARITGNTIIGSNVATIRPITKASTFTWNNNRYYVVNSDSTPFMINTSSDRFQQDQGGTPTSWSSWKNAGYDTSSTLSNGKPSTNVIITRPNAYEPGKRGHIAIYNWEGKTTQSVDISSIISPGTPYKIVDVQNYWGTPVLSGTYQGGTVNLPLTLTTISRYYGDATNVPNVHTSKEFNAFVVIATGTSTGPIPTTTPAITPRPTLTPATPIAATPRPTVSPTTPPGVTPLPTTRPTTPPSTSSRTIPAGDDASVKASIPDTNNGSASTLVIDTTPDPVEFTYLRFNLAGIAQNPTKATLRLYVVNGSTKTHQVNATSNSWNESTITYNLRPTLESPIATIPAVAANSWVEIDLTSHVQGKMGTAFSVALKALDTDGLHFHASENTNGPELVLDFAPPRIVGDADGDGLINGVDFVIWTKNYGGTNTAADFNQDRTVDFNDFFAWVRAYLTS